MVSGKNLAWIGIVLTLISGWNNIVFFVNSFTEGLTSIWHSLPEIIRLGLIIWIFYWLGNKKE